MITITLDGVTYTAPSVDELRRAGCKLVIRHYRYVADQSRKAKPAIPTAWWARGNLHPHGGATYALILAPNGTYGSAYVRCSRKDTFVRRVGYVLAVSRALESMPADGQALLTHTLRTLHTP